MARALALHDSGSCGSVRIQLLQGKWTTESYSAERVATKPDLRMIVTTPMGNAVEARFMWIGGLVIQLAIIHRFYEDRISASINNARSEAWVRELRDARTPKSSWMTAQGFD